MKKLSLTIIAFFLLFDIYSQIAQIQQNDTTICPGQSQTLSAILLHRPTITTNNLTGITQTQAVSGGNITNNGGALVTARGVCWSTSPNPTITDSITINGSGSGSFISNLSGLLSYTTYYCRAYATNIAGTAYGNEVNFTTLTGPCNGLSTIVFEGFPYDLVEIGNQCWFADNVRTAKYANYDAIPIVGSVNSEWQNLTTGAYCYMSTNSQNNDIYGKLYNWYTVADNRNVCPVGWHVPTYHTNTNQTIGDIDDLINTLGGMSTSGTKLKDTLTWANNNNNTNESGFSAPGSGRRDAGGVFYGTSTQFRLWSSTIYTGSSETMQNKPWVIELKTTQDAVQMVYAKNFGYSIRCIIDSANTGTAMAPPTTVINSVSTTMNGAFFYNIPAIGYGEVTDDGGAPVLQRGICWSTNPNPTTADYVASGGAGLGSFACNLTGLHGNTTYYVRAYAVNKAGEAYSNEVTFFSPGAPSNLQVGDSYAGGIIAYIFQPGDIGYIGQTHGLIAAPTDLGGYQWGCQDIYCNALAQGLLSGQTNTASILFYCSDRPIAASVCDELVLNSFDDWFLPSKDELNKLYLNQNIIGGFVNGYTYWSSSENGNAYSWRQNFSTNVQDFFSKSHVDVVRPIRYF